MKIKFLFAVMMCFLMGFSEIKAQEAEENSVVVIEKEEVSDSNQNQLNDAQLFEKKMLENRKNKKVNKKYTSTRRSGNSSSQKSGVKRKLSKKSSKGGAFSTKMPSLSGGMFVK